jgi:hypothetical protein
VNGLDFATYVLVVFFLLIPWWRLGSVVCALGYSVALPACIYVVGGYLVVDLLYVHQQTLFLLLLLTGLLAQIFWLFNRLGADSRKVQAAESCKLHLRNHHPDELDLVDQFIIEIEGDENHPDKAQWSRFADADGRCDRTSKQLELEFERWLERYLVQSEASESGIPALL